MAGADTSGEPSTRAFEALYQAHSHRIYQYCLSRLGNPADAEDATQEAFFRATRQLHRLVGEPAAYLTAVAHNVCYDLRRSRRHPTLPLEEVARPDDSPGPEICAVQRSLLTRAWIRLNRQERALLAHTYAGFSHEEIASATGLSAKAVSVGICRARKRVRQGASAAAIAGPLLVGRTLMRILRRAGRASGSPAVPAVASVQPAAMLAASVLASVTAVVFVGPHNLENTPAAGTANALSTAPEGPEGASIGETSAPIALTTDPAPIRAAGPSGGGSVAAPALVGGLPGTPTVAPPQGVPQNTSFDSMTPSPAYSSDHTIFAAGFVSVGCAAAECPALFVSHDGGQSWTAAGKAGYQDGTVLLPPDYPSDPTVFVMSTSGGLLRSTDGGQTFTVAVPVAGVAAISPASPAGHAEVLIAPLAGGNTLVYRDGTPGASPGPAMPASMIPSSLAFSPDGQTALIGGGLWSGPTSAARAVVESCSQLACTQELAFPATDNARVRLSSAAAGHLLVASTPQHVALSADGGRSFPNLLAAGGQVTAVAVQATSSGPTLLLATLSAQGGHQAATLSRSSDGGRTLAPVSTNLGQISSINTLLGLGSADWIAGVSSSQLGNPFGVRCSADGGTSWSSSC